MFSDRCYYNYYFNSDDFLYFREKRSVPLKEFETNLVENPIVTLSMFGALNYLGIYFTFLFLIMFYQLTAKFTGTTDICAARSLLNSIYVFIGICPELPPFTEEEIFGRNLKEFVENLFDMGWFSPFNDDTREVMGEVINDFVLQLNNTITVPTVPG